MIVRRALIALALAAGIQALGAVACGGRATSGGPDAADDAPADAPGYVIDACPRYDVYLRCGANSDACPEGEPCPVVAPAPDNCGLPSWLTNGGPEDAGYPRGCVVGAPWGSSMYGCEQQTCSCGLPYSRQFTCGE
jgi:hypothetical protein